MSTTNGIPTPKIARIWRGRTSAEKADEYAAYLHANGIVPLAKKALGVQSLRARIEPARANSSPSLIGSR
jgi:hypothetical protein